MCCLPSLLVGKGRGWVNDKFNLFYNSHAPEFSFPHSRVGMLLASCNMRYFKVVLKTHVVIPTLPLSWITTEAEESQSLNREENTKFEIPPTPSDNC